MIQLRKLEGPVCGACAQVGKLKEVRGLLPLRLRREPVGKGAVIGKAGSSGVGRSVLVLVAPQLYLVNCFDRCVLFHN